MKLLKTFSIVALLFTVLSCSKEPEVQLVNEALETNVQSRKTDTRLLLLKWKRGLKESEKEAIRLKYQDMKFLKHYELCETEDYETWEIYCGEDGIWCLGKESDTPVDTDDDVERIAFDLTCADID